MHTGKFIKCQYAYGHCSHETSLRRVSAVKQNGRGKKIQGLRPVKISPQKSHRTLNRLLSRGRGRVGLIFHGTSSCYMASPAPINREASDIGVVTATILSLMGTEALAPAALRRRAADIQAATRTCCAPKQTLLLLLPSSTVPLLFR